MRIQNNVASMNAHRHYTINNNALAKSTEKLSSGYKINRAADDAAGLAVSEKMRAQIRGLTVASQNAQDGVSLVQTAEGYLQDMQDILHRMKDLATQVGNDTYDESDRTYAQKEIAELIDELGDISERAEFNGIFLFSADVELVLQVGHKSGDEMTLEWDKLDATELGVNSIDVSTGTDGTDARTAIETINDALEIINELRATLGAYQNRLEYKISSLDNAAENLTAAESRIRDTDMAKEMTNYTKQSILAQAATAMLAQANSQPQLVLQLLG
ncbi:MAG: flagellin [Oscillospiraceae bacterium]|nr:flagellin [Oscillospiraceae bacterium]